MSESTEERKEEIKLTLAETIMKTIPPVPDDIHNKSPEEQERIFKMIDDRASRVLDLLGAAKRGRGPALNPRGPRRSERFNTPELNIGIAKKRKRDEQEELPFEEETPVAKKKKN